MVVAKGQTASEKDSGGADANGIVFCCANCAHMAGVTSVVDHA
jgi:hypothetical protein